MNHVLEGLFSEATKFSLLCWLLFNIVHVNFKHDLFDKLTLVGQVDKKFIAMSMNKNLDSSADNPDKELLLLFDQHAVHERVRIEQLLEGE